MRFISKSSNLLVVLKPGLPAQPIVGQPAVPTVSVRFKDGVAEVPTGDLTNLMLSHPGFGSDFIAADENGRDPYALSRIESEPGHVMTEIKFGTPIKREVKGPRQPLPPEIEKLIKETASNMAKEMLPGMVKAVLKGMVGNKETEEVGQNQKTEATDDKPKGKPGRPKKVVTETPTAE